MSGGQYVCLEHMQDPPSPRSSPDLYPITEVSEYDAGEFIVLS